MTAAKIPFIGTAVVTNPHWVTRLVNSIDYPVAELCIINNNGRGEIDAELDALAKKGNPLVDRIRVVHMPSNLGVAGSWNMMIKCYMNCPYWIILNDDVAFTPGFLEEMNTTALAQPKAGLIHGYSGDFQVGSWDLFLIRDFIIQEFGLFDENLYPAYNEDADYIMRFVHRPIIKVLGLKSEYYHGNGKKNEYYLEGSQTSKSDPVLKQKLDQIKAVNIDYLTNKWGPGWRYCSPHKFPFMSNPIDYCKFDLKFAREKHLGF
jgi:GT2 family glycosyltransferase